MGDSFSTKIQCKWNWIPLVFCGLLLQNQSIATTMLQDINDARKSYNTSPEITIKLWEKYRIIHKSLPKRFQYEWPLLASKAYLQKYQLNAANKLLIDMESSAKRQNRSDYSQYFNLIGIMFRRAERYDLASAAYKCAINILQNDESQKWLPGYYNNLGIVYALKGNNPAAIISYDKAIELAQKANARNSQGRYLYNKGLAYLDGEAYEKAVVDFKRAYYLKELPPKEDRKNAASPLSQFKTAIALIKALIKLRDWTAFDRYQTNFDQLAIKFTDKPDYIVYQWFLVFADFKRNGKKPYAERIKELVQLAEAHVVSNRNVDDVIQMASEMGVKVAFAERISEIRHVEQPERYWPILHSCNKSDSNVLQVAGDKG